MICVSPQIWPVVICRCIPSPLPSKEMHVFTSQNLWANVLTIMTKRSPKHPRNTKPNSLVCVTFRFAHLKTFIIQEEANVTSRGFIVNSITVFIRLTALGAYLILGAYSRWALIGEGGCLLFSQHFQQARTFLENNKTRDNKFISLQQDNLTKCKI